MSSTLDGAPAHILESAHFLFILCLAPLYVSSLSPFPTAPSMDLAGLLVESFAYTASSSTNVLIPHIYPKKHHSAKQQKLVTIGIITVLVLLILLILVSWLFFFCSSPYGPPYRSRSSADPLDFSSTLHLKQYGKFS